ncbi:MAG: glycosyltransferase [Caldimonas sp.]
MKALPPSTSSGPGSTNSSWSEVPDPRESRRLALVHPQRRSGNPYRSFWMAGFEGADHVNGHGEALDLVSANGHLENIEGDYALAARLGLRTLRESIGWRLSERVDAVPAMASTRRFDFSRAERMLDAANRHGLQILWTLMHYGRPADVDLFDDSFANRFADFAGAAARALRGRSDEAPVYTPINEISFLAWAISETDLIHPHRRATLQGDGSDVGWEVKWRLVKAALRAIDAIRAEDPRARFLHVEPLVQVVAPAHAPHLIARAEEVAAYQWQAWDMLQGTLLPELGGSPAALDLLGVNYYHNCQWELETGHTLSWHLQDPRRVSFSSLLRKAWKRYDRPLLVAETSHVGSGRQRWLDDVSREIERARDAGVPVQGVCLYPVIDRPDWSNAAHWHNSGLWDVVTEPATAGAPMRRRLHRGYAKTLRRAQRRLPQRPINGAPMTHLIVFSHLRWNFVFQRPQHLLSRLARHYHVLFVEEPIRSSGPAFLERTAPLPGVEVLRPHTPVEAGGFHDDQLSVLEPLLATHLADNLIDDYAVWFYTPMALPLLAELSPRAIVYDCMDELSAFKDAPRQMRQRETALLKSAQLVLTGGLSLYEAKRALNPNVMCLPSAVDSEHYAPAKALHRAEPMQRAEQLQGSIGGPRLGFFGVIDERLDMQLLAQLADADPTWQIVMVGPVVKIDPARLPQRPNIHWLGQQPYELLPQLVAGWDVCLMPFALNDATRFISPTKTLEYMAAGKPVVSTAISDVRSMFSDVVRIAEDPESFIDACRVALRENAHDRGIRLAEMQASVWRYSWDSTAHAVHVAIEAALAPRTPTPAVERPVDGELAAVLPATGTFGARGLKAAAVVVSEADRKSANAG